MTWPQPSVSLAPSVSGVPFTTYDFFIHVKVAELRAPKKAYAWGQEDGARTRETAIVAWLLKNGHRAAALAWIDACK